MRTIAALLLGVLAASAARAEPIAVTAYPLSYFSRTDPAQTVFGPLTFRGGLILTSTAKAFGGFSGIRVQTDGSFRAVSDRTQWLEGRIVYDGAKPADIENAVMFPILNAQGKKLSVTRGDSEALEVSGDTAWVGVERRHNVLRFDLTKGTEAGRGVPVAAPKGFADLPYNEGVEALGLIPSGPEKDTLLAVSEAGLDDAGNLRGWLLGGRTKKPARALSVKRRDDYAVTDLAFLPGGDLVVLERRYRPPLDLTMRLRRIALADIVPGAVLDGEVLLEAALANGEIDNMEGISAHRAPDGASVVTLISDNNFSGWQRTVLLQFGVAE